MAAVRALPGDQGWERIGSDQSWQRYAPTGGITYTTGDWNITAGGAAITSVNTPYITLTTTNTAGWINVTRDEIWNSWTATTTTATGNHFRYVWTDEQAETWNRWNTAIAHVEEAARQAILPTREAIAVIEAEVQRTRDIEQRRREAENRRRLEQQQRLQAQATEAHNRAEELFLSLLTAEQRVQWVEAESIHVRGSEGGLYELRGGGGVHGNISLIDEHGCRLANLCVASEMYDREHGVLPTPDGWVGQLLAIRHNEGALKQMANYSMRRECQQPGVPIIGGDRAA